MLQLRTRTSIGFRKLAIVVSTLVPDANTLVFGVNTLIYPYTSVADNFAVRP
jgi:hypothetical protein